MPEGASLHADHAAVFHVCTDVVAREGAMVDDGGGAGSQTGASAAYKVQIMEHDVIGEMGADGQGAFDYGTAASVGAAVEVHRPGGDAKVAGVGFRRKVDVHYCFRRNFLIDAL